MTTSRITRLIVALASLGFVAVAIAIWISPERAAHALGLEAIDVGGLAVVQADLGGLFAGLALLCAAAAWTMRRSWILAAVSILGAIVLGRIVGAAGAGFGGHLGELAHACRCASSCDSCVCHRAGSTSTSITAWLPDSACRGQTPDEMYFGAGDAVPADVSARAAAARRARGEANRSAACAACPAVDAAA